MCAIDIIIQIKKTFCLNKMKTCLYFEFRLQPTVYTISSIFYTAVLDFQIFRKLDARISENLFGGMKMAGPITIAAPSNLHLRRQGTTGT